MKLSPTYKINLIEQIEETLWAKYKQSKYVKVKAYIQQWHEDYFSYQGIPEGGNFSIKVKQDGNIDLFETLSNIKDDELILKIAIDLGLNVPSVIYSVPEIKGILADRYEDAADTFERAYQKIKTEPDMAITMANSALESIIKKINKDIPIPNFNKNDTLYKQASDLLKYFKYFPSNKLNEKIRNIGSGLLNVSKAIEEIRSDNTPISHGKLKDDYIIDDELYAHFVINAVSTVGLFLINYYENKYLNLQLSVEDEIPF